VVIERRFAMNYESLRRRVGSEAVALVAVALTAALGILILFSLDDQPTRELVVLVGGQAGAAASGTTRLVRISVRSSLDRTEAPFAAVFVPFISGFAAGAFSVLTALALFSTGPDSPSVASAAVFGGIYGLLLGGWANALFLAEETSELDRRSLLQAAVADVVGVVSPVAFKYNGDVLAWFSPAAERGRLAGSLMVAFVPREKKPPKESMNATTGPVRIDEGSSADVVPFEVSVLTPPDFGAYPRSRVLQVPASKPSDQYEFTIVRESGDSAESKPMSQRRSVGRSTAAAVAVPTVLLDVSQGGRTVQLLEIPMTVRTPLELDYNQVPD
jgi:hypothetical protein